MHGLDKAIALAKKTGDKIIVFDKYDPDNSFVLMSLDFYEKLTVSKEEVRNLTEEEMLDKINRDIALWKEKNKATDFGYSRQVDAEPKEYKNDSKDKQEDDEDMYYYDSEPEMIGNIINERTKEGNKNNEIKFHRNNWTIPNNIKKSAEEIIEDNQFN